MPELMTHALSDIKRESVQWLWPGRIPRGKVTLIAGDPGLGKSFLTMDIAARTTRGGSPEGDWPDGPSPLRGPGDVLILNAEDDPGDTLRPRLESAGADVSRVRIVEGVDRDEERSMGFFALDRDGPALSLMLRKLTGPRLVIIDPISAYMGNVDSHRNTDVRAVLAGLQQIAAAHNTAILCVTHLSKGGEGQSRKAVHRLMGSLAFAAAARMVWLVGRHPDDPDRRVLTLVKSNLEAARDGLSYRIERSEEHGDARIVWDETPFRGSADSLEDDELAERQSAVDEAESFLSQLLADGPVEAGRAIGEAQHAGISESAIRRARRRLGVRAIRSDQGGRERGWVWSIGRGEPAQPGPSA